MDFFRPPRAVTKMIPHPHRSIITKLHYCFFDYFNQYKYKYDDCRDRLIGKVRRVAARSSNPAGYTKQADRVVVRILAYYAIYGMVMAMI
jgi:hypothetical protein